MRRLFLGYEMKAWILVAMTLSGLGGCASSVNTKRQQIDELPKWLSQRNSVRYDLVEHFLDKGDTARAMEILRVLYAEGVDEPILEFYMGRALHAEGMLEDADQSFTKALAGMPRDARVYAAICLLRADQKRAEEGIEACDRASQLDGNRPETWNNLGWLLLESDQLAGAEEAFQNAVRADGTKARYRNNLGSAQVALGQVDRGLRTFMTTGSSADAHYMVAWALERYVNADSAVPYYQQAVDHDGRHSMAKDALERIANLTEETP